MWILVSLISCCIMYRNDDVRLCCFKWRNGELGDGLQLVLSNSKVLETIFGSNNWWIDSTRNVYLFI